MCVSLEVGAWASPRAAAALRAAPHGRVTGLGRTIQWFTVQSAGACRVLLRQARTAAVPALATAAAVAAYGDPPS